MKTKIWLCVAALALSIIILFFDKLFSSTPSGALTAPANKVKISVEQSINLQEQHDKPSLQPATTKSNDLNNESLIRLSRPDHELNGELSLHWQRLLNAYQQGDNEAGYVLSRNLRRCLNVSIKSKDALDTRLNKLYEAQEKHQLFSAEQFEQQKSQLEQDYYFCKDVPENVLIQELDILETLAHQGYVPAQQTYGLRFESLDLDRLKDSVSQADFVERKRQQELAAQFLKSAATNGGLTALAVLCADNRVLGGKHYREALKYSLVLSHFSDVAATVNEHQQIQHSLKKAMTAEDIEYAYDRSKQLIKAIRDKGVIYE